MFRAHYSQKVRYGSNSNVSFKKIQCTYTHHGILLRHENKILQFEAKWMDLENMHSERCLGRGIMQTEEDKYCITSVI